MLLQLATRIGFLRGSIVHASEVRRRSARIAGRNPIMHTRRKDHYPDRRSQGMTPIFLAHRPSPISIVAILLFSRDAIRHPLNNSVRFLNVAAVGPRACVCTIPAVSVWLQVPSFPLCSRSFLAAGYRDMCPSRLEIRKPDPTKRQRTETH